jgi:hypothetical protein
MALFEAFPESVGLPARRAPFALLAEPPLKLSLTHRGMGRVRDNEPSWSQAWQAVDFHKRVAILRAKAIADSFRWRLRWFITVTEK